MKFTYKNQLVTVKLNILGQYYTFLLDTGSEKSFLSPHKSLQDYKRKLLKKINVTGIGNDKIIEYAYVIPQIIMDNQMVDDVEFLIKHKNLMFHYLSIDGVLGWDILKRFDFMIDFRNNVLSIDDSHSKRILAGIPIIPASQLVVQTGYGGQNIETLIDLGANSSSISETLLLHNEPVKWRRSLILGINGFSINKNAEIKHLSLVFKDTNITIGPVYVKPFKYKWLLKLGTDSFKDLKIYVKNSEKEVKIIE